MVHLKSLTNLSEPAGSFDMQQYNTVNRTCVILQVFV